MPVANKTRRPRTGDDRPIDADSKGSARPVNRKSGEERRLWGLTETGYARSMNCPHGDWEHARDVCVDGEGNVYVAGGTASADFPTTAGALQRTQDKTGAQVGS